ncbi:unnamed protein product [Leptosia nina]|uniref:Uncharacterized protein n=1 Tax=Leptosia nina TaxID=320188 RepID=A0AAV1JHZ5_9NEOP
METDSAKEVKTYSRISRISEVDWMPKLNLSDTLSSREALQFLLNGTLRLRVCRYCLNITNNLCELDEVLVLAGKSGLYEVTIKDIIGSFHPIKVIYDENYPNKICTSCFENALQCYLFTQRCEQAERAFNNFFEDINEKFNKLDPMEPVKKRGKPKLKPNHNILYTEHRNVIDYAEPIINLIHLNTLSTNNDSNNLECPKCWQVLPNQMSLVNHEKAHPQTMWYHCKECGKAFVKYTQLKRHMRLGHEDIQNTECYMFTCKQCGCRNHSLNEHLLHIEKHRFTSALKDLVMKPEGNCDICFNKDVTVNLNESMHFQGMGKGLVGEKTIHTIASTIFPDRSYKYQELLIPLQAPILCPLKRKKEVFIGLNKKIKNTTEQRLRKINKENRHFVFSVPEKVHLLTYENVRNSIYEKEPNANNYFVNISITPHQPKNTEIDEKCQKKSESLPKIDDNINKNTGYHVNNGSQNLSPDKTSKELPIFNPGNAYLNQEETLMDTETQSNVEVMDFEEGNNIPEKRNITQNSTVDYIPTHAQIGITPNAEWQAPINNRMMFSIGTAQAERKRKKPTRRSSTFIK